MNLCKNSKVKAKGKHPLDVRVNYKQFKKLRFNSVEEKFINIDGENCGMTPFELTVKKNFFRLFAGDYGE